MKIYTKSGDAGKTGLFGGGRVSKHDARVDACGTVDELNATLGMARAAGAQAFEPLLESIQQQLFTVGAHLATPRTSKAARILPPIELGWVTAMETTIDALQEELPKLTAFVMPTGQALGATLHFARAVCRRAERRVSPLAKNLSPLVLVYLNRLSDLLFVMARAANFRAQLPELRWMPARPTS